MMLRALAVLLLLANIAYFAWARGGLAGWGAVPAQLLEAQPQRLTQQVRPDALRIRIEPDAGSRR